MRHLTLFLVLFLFGCNPERQSRKKIESLQKADQSQKYEVGISCMEYISHYGDDLSYSKTLVTKLLEVGFFAEAISAVELLLKKFPTNPELLFLRSIAYRNLHQYGLALADLSNALALQPQNNTISAGARSTKEEQVRWIEIQYLNELLTTSDDSVHVLLQRAEKFIAIRQYDAVLYDLGSVSKMGSPDDSIYFTAKVSALYKSTRLPVEELSEMLEYFKDIRKGR